MSTETKSPLAMDEYTAARENFLRLCAARDTRNNLTRAYWIASARYDLAAARWQRDQCAKMRIQPNTEPGVRSMIEEDHARVMSALDTVVEYHTRVLRLLGTADRTDWNDRNGYHAPTDIMQMAAVEIGVPLRDIRLDLVTLRMSALDESWIRKAQHARA